MISTLSTPKSHQYFEILPENLQSTPACHESFLQRSEINSLQLINSERFAELNSFSLRNFIFVCESQDKAQDTQRQADHCYLSDPLFNVLSLRRGKSQCYFNEEEKISQAQQYFIEEPTTLIDMEVLEEREGKLKHLNSHLQLPFLPEHEDSQGDSKLLQSTSNEALTSEKEMNPSQTKVSTKNVTKNMGKLLFKYIWKNRISLRKFFDMKNEDWESFIAEIRVWKKENNITRQFLSSRWHSPGKNSKIFRMVSQHFFRKRCLSAILESKIECKEMHIKRLKRFQEAISNPNALDNLN